MAKIRVNTTDTGPADVDQTDGTAVLLTNGNFVILYQDWSDGGPGGAPGKDIIGQLFDSRGYPMGDEFRANQNYYIDDEQNFDAAPLDGGGFVIVYEDDSLSRDGKVAIRATEWTTTETALGTSTTRTIADVGDVNWRPSVAADGHGGYVVAYEKVTSSRYDTKFVSVSKEGIVGQPENGVAYSQADTIRTDVAVLTDGSVVVVNGWSGDKLFEREIAYSFFSKEGEPLTGGPVGNTDTDGNHDSEASIAALADGGFVVAWTNVDDYDTDIFFQIYDGDGNPRGGATGVDNSSFRDNNTDPNVLAFADGTFAVIYDDNEVDALTMHRYTALGVSMGAPKVIETNTNEKDDPFGLAFPDGRFIVGWSEEMDDNTDVFAAGYHAPLA